METLRRLRTTRGLSQAKLAARAELDPSTVNQIERGAREASPATLRKLADALDVSLAELLEDTYPKEGRRSSPELSFNDVLEDERHREQERHRGYLRAWRAFVNKLAQRWEEVPPETASEVSVVLDAMQVLTAEGAFERPPNEVTTGNWGDVSEWMELSLLFRGIDRLNKLADAVEQDANAKRRRDAFAVIRNRMAG